jgi:hypothetical protein
MIMFQNAQRFTFEDFSSVEKRKMIWDGVTKNLRENTTDSTFRQLCLQAMLILRCNLIWVKRK